MSIFISRILDSKHIEVNAAPSQPKEIVRLVDLEFHINKDLEMIDRNIINVDQTTVNRSAKREIMAFLLKLWNCESRLQVNRRTEGRKCFNDIDLDISSKKTL